MRKNKTMNEIERRAFVEEFAITTVALTIAEAIKETGMSQREIADRLGVTEARISQVVNATGNPTVKSLARLADVLGRELRVELAHGSHVPDQSTDWQVGQGTWAEFGDDEGEANEQEQYVAVAA